MNGALLFIVEPDLLRELPGPSCIGLIILGAVMIGLILIRRFLLKRSVPRTVERPGSPPPHEEALSALADLERGMPHEEPQLFFISLAAIVKLYTARRFGVGASFKTSEELTACLESAGLSELALLDDLLLRCDRVKFSGRSDAARAAADCIEQARNFVKASLSSGEAAP